MFFEAPHPKRTSKAPHPTHLQSPSAAPASQGLVAAPIPNHAPLPLAVDAREPSRDGERGFAAASTRKLRKLASARQLHGVLDPRAPPPNGPRLLVCIGGVGSGRLGDVLTVDSSSRDHR